MSKAISESTAPIFRIFSLNGRYLCEFSRSGPVFLIPQGTLPWQPILWQNYLPPALIALAFRNGMGYRYLNVRINSVNDASMSCKNFVKLQLSFATTCQGATVWRRAPYTLGFVTHF